MEVAAKEAKQVRPEMIIVPEDNLTVQELADKLSLESSEIIKSLFFKGITATVTQSLDLATIETVAEEFGCLFCKMISKKLQRKL